ncbi:phosphatase PAP2 family protein [Photobacterium sagamiensis]|uniref:phosphatase PAP2 family protein n=1 Tax=Photobacterium sagamiensis TaxID=2910241 RepID=UPI003D0FC879
MLISSFISKKIPGVIALSLFAVLMAGVLVFFPQPAFTTEVNDLTGLLFTLLTDSAGNPYFLITTGLLCLIPLFLKYPKGKLIRLWIQFGILLALSFVAKTGLKHITEIPRPYSYELQSLGLVDSVQNFYQLDDTNKEAVVEQAADNVSHWRIRHWQGETNYSMPSGHTIFAAVCVVFWGGFFLRRKQLLPAFIIILWATGVGTSRIWLGMHWPSDLLVSITCAGILYCLIPEWEINGKEDKG